MPQDSKSKALASAHGGGDEGLDPVKWAEGAMGDEKKVAGEVSWVRYEQSKWQTEERAEVTIQLDESKQILRFRTGQRVEIVVSGDDKDN